MQSPDTLHPKDPSLVIPSGSKQSTPQDKSKQPFEYQQFPVAKPESDVCPGEEQKDGYKDDEEYLQNYKIGKVLGKGAYGKVHLGLHRLANMFVAMKSMSKKRLKEGKGNNKQKVDNEVGLLKQIDHQGIVKLYEIFETEKHYIIIIELCPGGDMIGYVR